MTPAATAQAAAGPDLTFATFTVCKTSCGTGQFAWSKQRINEDVPRISDHNLVSAILRLPQVLVR